MNPKSSVGDLPAFPVPPRPAGAAGAEPPVTGMTYRQWLVGMALSSGKIGMQAVEAADNVLKMLEKTL